MITDWLFCFKLSDVLLYTTPIGNGNFKLNNALVLTGMKVSDIYYYNSQYIVYCCIFTHLYWAVVTTETLQNTPKPYVFGICNFCQQIDIILYCFNFYVVLLVSVRLWKTLKAWLFVIFIVVETTNTGSYYTDLICMPLIFLLFV